MSSRATSSLFSADDPVWLGSSPPTDRHRIPSERESAAQRPAARQAYPVQQCRASAAREKSEGSGTQGCWNWRRLFLPIPLLRWHRRLIAEKWNFAHRRGPGRPGIMQKISGLIVRMAQDNPGWGYTRIQGALANLGHRVGRGTVANVLKRSGIEPSPERSKRTTSSTFLKAHWKRCLRRATFSPWRF